jgi:hypothetical protein
VIPRGAALTWDGDRRKFRLMTDADDASLFKGIAWEEIADGEEGRVKTSGGLPTEDLWLKNDVVISTLAFGDSFSIDPAEDGRLIKGGTMGLLPVIESARNAIGFYSAAHQVAL